MKNLLGASSIFPPQPAAPNSVTGVRQLGTKPCRRIAAQPFLGARRGVATMLAAGVLVVLFTATGCVGEANPPQQAGMESTEPSEAGVEAGIGSPEVVERINVGVSGALRAMSIEELTRESSIVAVGTVREVSAGQWSTADGKRPVGFRLGPDMPIIFREAMLQVEEYVKGSDAKELTILLKGGQVGSDNIKFPEEVSLDPREKVLVFLARHSSPPIRGRPGYGIFGATQGKYRITDGLAAGTRPSDTVPLKDLIGRIRAAIGN